MFINEDKKLETSQNKLPTHTEHEHDDDGMVLNQTQNPCLTLGSWLIFSMLM